MHTMTWKISQKGDRVMVSFIGSFKTGKTNCNDRLD